MMRGKSRTIPGVSGLRGRAQRPSVVASPRPNRNSVQYHGLLRWVPFQHQYDEGNSTTVFEVAFGERNSLANFAGGNVTSTIHGRCVEFTTTDSPDWFEFSDLELSPPLSLTAWVQPDSANWSTTVRQFGKIVCKPTSTGADPFVLWSLGGNNTNPGKFSADISDGTAGSLKTVVSTTTVTANQLYHVALTYDSANLRIFVDGLEEASTATTIGIGTSTENWHIGHFNGSGGNNQWVGNIYDVRIYSVPLSAGIVWQMWDPRTRWDLYDLRDPGEYAFQVAPDGWDAVFQPPPRAVPRVVSY